MTRTKATSTTSINGERINGESETVTIIYQNVFERLYYAAYSSFYVEEKYSCLKSDLVPPKTLTFTPKSYIVTVRMSQAVLEIII
jgi:hypothetical protein